MLFDPSFLATIETIQLENGRWSEVGNIIIYLKPTGFFKSTKTRKFSFYSSARAATEYAELKEQWAEYLNIKLQNDFGLSPPTEQTSGKIAQHHTEESIF